MSPLKFLLILCVGGILAFVSSVLHNWKESVRENEEEK